MRRTIYAILISGAMVIAVVSCTESNPSPPAETKGGTFFEASAPAATQAADDPRTTSTSNKAAVEPARDDRGDAYTHQSLAAGSPGMNTFAAPGPGLAPKADRSYPGAPPTIPHSVEGLAVTKDSNSCASCHSAGLRLGEGHVATLIPESHYTDLQTGEKQTGLAGRRYNCVLCHVPQAEAEPRVAN